MRKQIPECSIIIPVFNKWELTRNCLASLREHSSGHDLEIIVVDNGSSDATAPELASYGTGLFGARFGAIVFSENRNFGPACNAGARAATSPVLFFLNNDTLATPGWLPPLLTGLDGLGCGALGPVLLYEDGTVQHMGVTYGTRGPSHLYQHFPPDHPVVSRKRELQGITGAALMIRADIFRECGEFYEGYRNGFEDLELCVQIRRKGGRLRCLASSRMFHLESQTPGRKDGDAANGDIFAKRCGDAVYTDIHHHALRDGFSFFITDLLTVSAKLQEK
ncbi:MAG: glycosyltransferase family 2 protein, partial [Deltaproteobacteria bacterium]|nr:glycosyltransferase family 2 protein [Deltaproteobacteria bacterium]